MGHYRLTEEAKADLIRIHIWMKIQYSSNSVQIFVCLDR